MARELLPSGIGTSWVTHTIAVASSVAGTEGPLTVFAADLDGDGDLDVASASFPNDEIVWYRNQNGSGTSWSTRQLVFTSANGPRSVFAADVDGDGDADLVSASGNDDTIRWHENLNGIATSWSTVTISSAVDLAQGLYVADVDGDGDLDALSASRADDEVWWSENVAGDGSSWTSRTLSTLADRPYSVFAGDVDGDGDVDVLSASADDDQITWYENRTIHRSALFGDQVVMGTIADQVLSMFPADVDGDGDLDALSASFFDDEIDWYENENGSGTSWTPRTIVATADAAYSMFAADVDGDGDLDALAAASGESTIEWYENENGSGTSWTTRTIATAAQAPVSVFAADVDGDGDVDALSASILDDEIAWYENVNPASTDLWPARTIASNADSARSVVAADVDGDGDLDVLSASADDDTIAWYENLSPSSTAPWPVVTIATTADSARSVFAADVDGDGDLDALSASASDNLIAWYENSAASGNGTSWIPRTISATALNARWVHAADLDADGDMDALSAANTQDEIAWYENVVGDGTAWTKRIITTTETIANAPRAVFAADVDGDGDVDALSGSFNDDKIAWYPNRGGQFALPTTALAQGILANSQEDVVLRIDLEHRGRAGDSDVELDTIELLLEDGFGTPLTSAQADNLIAKLELFLDDGSGSFESPGDALVELVDSFNLVAGVQSVSLAGGGPNVEAAFGESKRYFVVVTLTPAASLPQVSPDSFEVVHLTEASSTARDASVTTVPLRLEHHPDTTTGLVDTNLTSASCKAPFELDLQNFTVTSAIVCEAGTTIHGNGLLVANPVGALTLRAGQRVRLASDLTVTVGATLTIEIDPSLEP